MSPEAPLIQNTRHRAFCIGMFLLLIITARHLLQTLNDGSAASSTDPDDSLDGTISNTEAESDYYVYDFDADGDGPDFENLPQPQIIIKVLAYNRFQSLERTLNSLKDAHYDGDTVHLDIFLDHIDTSTDQENYANYSYPILHKGKDHSSSGDSNVQMTEAQKEKFREYASKEHLDLSEAVFVERFTKNEVKLSEVHSALYYLYHEFEWPHGDKRIHYRQKNVGLQAQWIEQWWPSSTDEFAYVVEDDVVVSKWWYRYIKKAIQAYYYDDNLRDDQVFGISTQKQTYSVGKDENGVTCFVKVLNHNRPFLFGTIGTWGQLLFPRHWIQFRLWYDKAKLDSNFGPVLENVGRSGLRTTGWYKSAGNKIWTPWFLYFLEMKKWYGMYVNFPSSKYLSISYQEIGVSYKVAEGANAPLVSKRDDLKWVFPPAHKLQVFDACFSLKKSGRVFNYSSEMSQYESYEFQKFLWDFSFVFRITVLVYGADDPAELPLYRSWICKAEASSINRYIFVTGNQEVALELMRQNVGVFFVPGLDQFKYNETRYENGGVLSYEDGITGLLHGTSKPFSKYRITYENDETFNAHLKNFDYYIRKHHLKAVFLGASILSQRESYQSSIDKALDILAAQAIRYGFNVATSHVRTLINRNPLEPIIEKELTQKISRDIFVVPAFNATHDPLDLTKGKSLKLFDNRQWMFIKCNKVTQDLFMTGLKENLEGPSGSNYQSFLNVVVDTALGRYYTKNQTPKLSQQVQNFISQLNFKVLSSNYAYTLSDAVRLAKENVFIGNNAYVVLSDVNCCLNEERITKNKSADSKLWTTLDAYQALLEKARLSQIDRNNVMCLSKACYSVYYRWVLENQVRDFDERN